MRVLSCSGSESSVDSPAHDLADAAGNLYSDCLAYFTILSQTTTKVIDQTEQKLLKEGLGRFYLWGEGFQDGKLEKVLKTSPDLRNTIVRLLIALGRALVKSYQLLGKLIDDKALASMTRELQISLENCRLLARSDLDRSNEDDDDETVDEDDMSEIPSDTDDESEDDINFYLNLLMNLSPSMEQVYSQAIKEEGNFDSIISEHSPKLRVAKPLQSFNKTDEKKRQSFSDSDDTNSATLSTLPDEAVSQDLQNRFIKVMREMPKARKVKLRPKVPIPPSEAYAIRFQKQMHSLSEIPLKYEQPAYLDEALSVIPLEAIYNEAEDESSLQQAQAASISDTQRPEWGYQDFVIRALMRWFKRDFFSYVTNPACTNCSAPTVGTGFTKPTVEESIQGGHRVELYQCSAPGCGAYVRFPRLSDAVALLKTRRGRLGEWVNCFTLLCRAIGARVRYIWCAEDQVWTEVYSEHQRRWVHVDPCEQVWNRPRLYSQGWARKMSYCIAFSIDGATDVTRRYVRNFETQGNDRIKVPEDVLIYILREIREMRRRGLGKQEKARIVKEDEREDKELQMYIVRAITQNIVEDPAGAMNSRSSTDELRTKSQSDLLERAGATISNELGHETEISGEDIRPPAYEPPAYGE